MRRLHKPGRAEILLWLCSAALLCTAAAWPGALNRSFDGGGAGEEAAPSPRVIAGRALVIRDELVLSLPEGAVTLAGDGKRLPAYAAYAALSSDTGDLLRSLEAARLAGEDDLQLRLAEARQSGDALLMEAALTGEAPEPELGGAEPLFAGVSGLYADTVDGLEELGAGEALALDAKSLSALLAEDAQPQPGARLVTGWRWYCAVLTGEELEPGTEVLLRLGEEQFTARVERSGEGVLLLSGTDGMDRLLGLRQVRAEIEVP